MLRTYRYRLYPSKAQATRLAATLETTRRFYNDCLAERKAAWETEQRSVTKTEQLRGVAVRKATDPDAATVHSHILQVACADLDKAFRAFFRRVNAGEAPGYPRFKGRNRFDSFGLKEYGNGFKIDGRRLRLHGVGRVAVRWHRELPSTPKTVRILRRAGVWYAAFVCEAEGRPLPASGRSVGIDVGITHLIATSDGETVDSPSYYRQTQRALRVVQRRVARRAKGDANGITTPQSTSSSVTGPDRSVGR
jgi:putative transposase